MTKSFDVRVNALRLAHDRVEFFLVLGGRRISGASVYREVPPGADEAAVAASVLPLLLARAEARI